MAGRIALLALFATFCSVALAGGSCRSPDGLTLSDAEYVALLERLRSSMRTHDVPLAARNELLETLAPLRRGPARH